MYTHVTSKARPKACRWTKHGRNGLGLLIMSANGHGRAIDTFRVWSIARPTVGIDGIVSDKHVFDIMISFALKRLKQRPLGRRLGANRVNHSIVQGLQRLLRQHALKMRCAGILDGVEDPFNLRGELVDCLIELDLGVCLLVLQVEQGRVDAHLELQRKSDEIAVVVFSIAFVPFHLEPFVTHQKPSNTLQVEKHLGAFGQGTWVL